MPKVLILMATYNGERFIREQLESIAAQTHREWELWVRDDGSSDATLSVVRDFAGRHPGRVRVIEDDEKHLGPCRNFARLMELALRESDAEYFALSDQDDVWREDKLQVLLGAVQKLPADCPALAFSDLEIVDEHLKTMRQSFFKFYRVPNEIAELDILFRNVAPGCAMLFNRATLGRSVPIPEEAIMHDWWLMLVAMFFGNISAVRSQLVLYRQHDSNAVGVRNVRDRIFDSFRISRVTRKFRELNHLSRRQAEAIKRGLADSDCHEDRRNIIDAYLRAWRWERLNLFFSLQAPWHVKLVRLLLG